MVLVSASSSGRSAMATRPACCGRLTSTSPRKHRAKASGSSSSRRWPPASPCWPATSPPLCASWTADAPGKLHQRGPIRPRTSDHPPDPGRRGPRRDRRCGACAGGRVRLGCHCRRDSPRLRNRRRGRRGLALSDRTRARDEAAASIQQGDAMTSLEWTVVVILALVLVAWYLSYNAARLDRLHARAEGTLAAWMRSLGASRRSDP